MRTAALALALFAAPALAAELGQPAPQFELRDLDGKPVKLADFRGKAVVLEWFNPGCPFVNASHRKGTLKGLAASESAKGVVWLAVNSAAPGKQGFGADANRAAARAFGLSHPILLDPEGQVGRAYGATRTPGMFVIDAAGRLVYRGAIDNAPDGEGEAPQGGPLVDYVSAALDDLAAGRPVRHPESTPYGCTVKYGS